MDSIPFVSLLIFFIIGCTLSAVLMGISNFLGQKRKLIRKNDVYESGVDAVGNTFRQYDIKFFLTAILFLLFDVEIVFLLPWAIAYKETTAKDPMIFGFVFFMSILLVGYLFVINSKALKWEK